MTPLVCALFSWKLWISRPIPWKRKLSRRVCVRRTRDVENYSQGIIFVVNSCQRIALRKIAATLKQPQRPPAHDAYGRGWPYWGDSFFLFCDKTPTWLGKIAAPPPPPASISKVTGRLLVDSVCIRTRQRSGEGVVRRNGCPKGCFWRVRFFSAPLRFALKTPERSWKP